MLQVFAGHKPTAEEIRALSPLSVIKSEPEDRTHVTVLNPDTELFLDVLSGHSYIWFCWLIFEGDTAGSGDLSLELTAPGAALPQGALGNNLSDVVKVDGGRMSGSWQFATHGATNLTTALLLGSLIADADGQLVLSWGQNSSSGTPTIIHDGSWLLAIES